MATRKRTTAPRAPAPPPPEPDPKDCAHCGLFDYRDQRSGLCRLPPPFQVVHPSDRCNLWEPRG